MSEPTHPRHWFRFSLRTLFVVVTLGCLWLGWQVRLVRERQAIRQWLVSHGDRLRINHFNERHKWQNHREHLNVFRTWIGDEPVDQITLNSRIASSEMKRVERAFPNSLIDGWIEPAELHP